MRFNKKAALELSITGVVVLIIAIVVLGSIIYFIKYFFGETTGLIKGQLAKVKEQLRTTMEETGESIALDFGKEFELDRGKSQTFYIGIRNEFTNPDVATDPTKNSVCYRVGVKCLKSFSSQECTSPGKFVGGYDDTGTLVTGGWFRRLLTDWDLPNQQLDANPATIQVTTAPADTYQMELIVYKEESDKTCADQGGFQIWQSKRFLINLK